jgi:Na+-transporting methylmalonyl-CoA/oxaloacetate decarboxylase gamma subunit
MRLTDPNLVTLSLSAFLAVLVVLSFLALVIRGLAFVFRERGPAATAAGAAAPTGAAPADAHTTVDAALVAALQATLARQHPGHRVTRIEERPTRGAS